MTMRFIKCLVLVALVHVFAAAMVFGAYHFTKAGNKAFVETNDVNPGTETVLAGTSAQTAPTGSAEHKVKSGESYWSIAKQYNVKMQTLMTHNGHNATHVLKVGDVIGIPSNEN